LDPGLTVAAAIDAVGEPYPDENPLPFVKQQMPFYRAIGHPRFDN